MTTRVYHFSCADGDRDCQVCGAWGPGVLCVRPYGSVIITRDCSTPPDGQRGVECRAKATPGPVEWICRSCMIHAIEYVWQIVYDEKEHGGATCWTLAWTWPEPWRAYVQVLFQC